MATSLIESFQVHFLLSNQTLCLLYDSSNVTMTFLSFHLCLTTLSQLVIHFSQHISKPILRVVRLMPRSFGYKVLQILIDWIDRIAVEAPFASGLLLGLQNKTSYRAFGVAKEPQDIRPWKISDHQFIAI